MIEAVIVDLDDTLCMTEAVSFEIENMALSRLGCPPIEREIHLKTWGKPLFEVISVRSPGVNVAAFKAAYLPLIADFVKSGRLDSIPAENYEALDELIMSGKKIMVLTSRTHKELKHMLAPDHLLAKRVKAFYYRDNMEFHKPDPRAFDKLLSDMGIQPHRCVYVGDSLGDASAAKQAGLKFVASLESGIRQKADFENYDVDAFIESFPELVNAVMVLDGQAK